MTNPFKASHFTLPTAFSTPKNGWDVADALVSGGGWAVISSTVHLLRNIAMDKWVDGRLPGFVKSWSYGLIDWSFDIANEALFNFNWIEPGAIDDSLVQQFIIPQYPFRNINNTKHNKEIISGQYFDFYFKSLKPSYYKNENKAERGILRFNPIITTFSEQYAPSWKETEILGHILGIHNYKTTKRTLNLGFDLFAIDKAEMKFNMDRLNWLAEHTYGGLNSISNFTEEPSDPSAFAQSVEFKEFPFIEVTIGNVVKEQPCYMTALNINHAVGSDAVWDLNKQLPHKVSITLNLTILYKEKHLNDKTFYEMPGL